MDDKMATIRHELVKEREEADKLVKRTKLKKLPTFQKNGHETQGCFNEELASKLGAVKDAVEEAPPSTTKVVTAVEKR